MAKKKMEWTVRVVNWTDKRMDVFPRVWIEQLRYMGLANPLADYGDRNVLEFLCPDKRQINTRVWAEQNAARMRSFGIDAAAAPKWAEERDSVSVQTPAAEKGYLERLNRPGDRRF